MSYWFCLHSHTAVSPVTSDFDPSQPHLSSRSLVTHGFPQKHSPSLPPTNTHSQTSLLNPTAQQQPAYQLVGPPDQQRRQTHAHFPIPLPVISLSRFIHTTSNTLLVCAFFFILSLPPPRPTSYRWLYSRGHSSYTVLLQLSLVVT